MMSSSLFSRIAAPAPIETPLGRFERQVSALTALTPHNPNIFASPLGRIALNGGQAWMPRFVFFGPHATDDSWRLAFLAGFDGADLRASSALLHFVAALAERAAEGHGLNLAFFPLVDVGGALLSARSRGLKNDHWSLADAPELALLAKDARVRGYHGFVRVETAPPGDDVMSLRVRAPFGLEPAPDVELISSEEVEPFHVRFERASGEGAVGEGPLSIAGDLAIQPFELALRVPASWTDEIYFAAVRSILGRFVMRYRAFQAYGQHL